MVNFSRLLNEFSVNSFDLSDHCMVSSLFNVVSDMVCCAAHRMAQKKTALRNSQSGIFKSAATYFHKPFPANYLGHE